MDEVESGVHYPQGQLSMELPAISSHVRPPSLHPTRSRSWMGVNPVGAGRDDRVGDLSPGEKGQQEAAARAAGGGKEHRRRIGGRGEEGSERGDGGAPCGDGGAREVWEGEAVSFVEPSDWKLTDQNYPGRATTKRREGGFAEMI
ncbi:unnamed protein product [Urochloa humidicola]